MNTDGTTLERIKSRPLIKEGFPGNQTVLVGTEVNISCSQVFVDLQPYVEWMYSRVSILNQLNDILFKNITVLHNVSYSYKQVLFS